MYVCISMYVCMYVYIYIYREIVCKEQTEEREHLIVYVVSNKIKLTITALMQNHKHL
ncbi:MAG: hypothetical protein K0R16_38 [Nitrososphaeraceae archaeon]|nr:hypothetical protein [Nitrososphaeraceae archaeon]